MAKKSFGNGFDSILSSADTYLDDVEEPKQTSQPKKNPKPQSTNKQTPSEAEISPECRTTVYVAEDLYEKVQAIAYWERQKIKEVIGDAMTHFLKKKGDKYVKQVLEAYRNK